MSSNHPPAAEEEDPAAPTTNTSALVGLFAASSAAPPPSPPRGQRVEAVAEQYSASPGPPPRPDTVPSPLQQQHQEQRQQQQLSSASASSGSPPPTTTSLAGLFVAPPPPPQAPETPRQANIQRRTVVQQSPPLSSMFVPPTTPTTSLSQPPLFVPPPTNNNNNIDRSSSSNNNQSTTNNQQETTALLSMFDPHHQGDNNSTNNNRSYHSVVTTAAGAPVPQGQEEGEYDDSACFDNDGGLDAFQSAKDDSTGSATYQQRWWKTLWQQHLGQPTTYAGSFMFLLYHVVFCLANGSAIIRPHSLDQPILGMMAKMTTVGIMFAGPIYIFRLGSDVAALYPSVDLFLAPFLAEAASIVDTSLFEQYGEEEYHNLPDSVFFSTFAVLTGIGMLLAGAFLQLAATFKLANFGTYLPYSVLSGFFSAVGVLLWCLAFSVDSSGRTWKMVFFSGDHELIMNSLLHHIPSLLLGIVMNRLGPKNPFFVIFLLIANQIVFYLVMWITNTSLEEAQQAEWFWSHDDLVIAPPSAETTGSSAWESWTRPPAPLANLWCLFSQETNFKAVFKGLGNMGALAFLYLLRSSIHASALKKNIGYLVRRIPKKSQQQQQRNVRFADVDTTQRGYNRASNIFSSVRDSVNIVNMSLADRTTLRITGAVVRARVPSEDLDGVFEASEKQGPRDSILGEEEEDGYTEIRAKSTSRSLEDIFKEYGFAFFVVAAFGGFGNCPTVATSNTMFAIGADGPAPQYGSILLLLIFYFTDFELVKYIPKTAFSSLLVLGSVDTLVVWFFGAFNKTQDLTEWLVVPLIVAFSLVVGFLNAVFLGIAISMFVFVASFFRVGVVKFSATGLEIRSRVERSMAQSVWLDENGDYIQVLILQNYLFFGNASSVLSYISTMFEKVDEAKSQRLDFTIPPIPRVLVLDLSLITGMDSSTIDIFAEIKDFCKENECKLYFCGLSPRMRKGFALGGIKPDRGSRLQRIVRYFQDLDSAMGKAEDFLLHSQSESTDDFWIRGASGPGGSGFQFALKQIDELHGQTFSNDLLGLEARVVPLELEAGECLFQCDGGVVQDSHRGLFFIESGLLKIERNASNTMTMTRTYSRHTLNNSAALTLKHQHARMGSVARKAALAKAGAQTGAPNLRVMRIGPGWVCGTLENASGVRPAGVTIAVTRCKLHHLPFHKLEQLEKDEPFLVLRLYKMLQHLMARKEEITLGHLSTLHTIMSSPAHSKPIGRAAMKAMFNG